MDGVLGDESATLVEGKHPRFIRNGGFLERKVLRHLPLERQSKFDGERSRIEIGVVIAVSVLRTTRNHLYPMFTQRVGEKTIR